MNRGVFEIDLSKFETFCGQLRTAVNPRKDGSNPPPWGYPDEITATMLAEPLDEAAAHLPGAYHDAYYRPVRASLDENWLALRRGFLAGFPDVEEPGDLMETQLARLRPDQLEQRGELLRPERGNGLLLFRCATDVRS